MAKKTSPGGIRKALGVPPGASVRAHDRYSSTGTPRPTRETVCSGHCEGMGCFPTEDVTPAALARDRGALPKGAKKDEIGYYFVNCTACGGDATKRGSGRRDGKPMGSPT